MRCKKHVSDPSSSIGVCASCLRHRLLSLLHSQNSHPTPQPDPNPNPNPPLVFPRSVSPYTSRQRQPHRFHSTPFLDPTTTSTSSSTKSKSSKSKLGLISKLFRSRSGKSQPSVQSTSASTTTSASSTTYFYGANPKGMSPDREWFTDEFPAAARSVTRPSPGRVVKASPARAAGLAFCLSPLVRPSPARHCGGGGGDVAVGYSGEIVRVSDKPHLSVASSFCANRSRKLADFGRLNRNR